VPTSLEEVEVIASVSADDQENIPPGIFMLKPVPPPPLGTYK
jgi:hypothetical protein